MGRRFREQEREEFLATFGPVDRKSSVSVAESPSCSRPQKIGSRGAKPKSFWAARFRTLWFGDEAIRMRGRKSTADAMALSDRLMEAVRRNMAKTIFAVGSEINRPIGG